ncbi:uncharacterized protein IL334_006072 [Kwoniella shivajii]|uniref:RING-type domain-containing protein n=1 Tax=Kwoniella shivajii TaxID=564305 RepID=A0ABZ1D6G3_9TREE|nr:hypothetical protein IL334_006072 [Kwoniella shivajii]
MSFNTPPGQSSFDFGNDPIASTSTSSSTWRGLRRALSLGSGSNINSTCGGNKRQFRATNVSRLSRQLKGVTTTTTNSTTTTSTTTSSNTSANGSKGDYHRQLSETDISSCSDLRDVDGSIEDEWHNNMVVWKEGEGISIIGSGSINSNSRSRSIVSTLEREDVPSGPSSPCDTDHFSLSDYTTTTLPSFPNPPISLPSPLPTIIKDDGENKLNTIDILRSPFTSLGTHGSPPSDLDSSPTDPQFPFHPTTGANTYTNTDTNTDTHTKQNEKFVSSPVLIVSTSPQSPYRPPCPTLTPSPQFSSSNSPILITPGVCPSPGSSGPSSPDKHNKKDIDYIGGGNTLAPLIPINTSPASSSTHPLFFPSRLTLDTATSTKTNVPIITTEDANHSDSPLKRTISSNKKDNDSEDQSLQSPIVLSTRDVSDNNNVANRSSSIQSEDSMTFGDNQSQRRQRDWASYGDQNRSNPLPPQPASTDPLPGSYDTQHHQHHHHHHHHKPQPSVPVSTRTTSTISGGHNFRLTNVDPGESLSPPPSYGNFTNSSNSNSSRRDSKNTALSGSSGSSILSYSTTDSSSYRDRGHLNQHWQFGGQPDISTVFEEEGNSVEFGEDQNLKKDQYEFGIPVTLKSRSRENSDSGHPRYRTLTHQTSSNTLVNRPPTSSTKGYFSRERSGTIDSQAGTITSNHSGKSFNKVVHPFANTIIRPTSPVIPTSKSHNTFLSPQHPKRQESLALQNSRSSPNLAETYKMSQPAHQLALVSTEDDKDDEETCPVCVESLSFTYRLPGEKPHIVPDCGHALHEECFVTVYGDVPPEGSKKVLGVCGVCRQPMRMADGGNKRDKLAVLMGQSGHNPVRKSSQSAPSARSVSGRRQNPSPTPPDPNADDPLEGGNVSSSRSMHSESSQPKVVVPSISIRSEYPSIAKGHRKGKQVITAMVTVEVPSAGDRGRYPTKPRSQGMSRSASGDEQYSPPLPPSPRSASEIFGVPSTALSGSVSTPDPFAHVVNDLKHRVVDYKTSGLDQLGSLRLFDLLCVRKGQLIREFHVYLFQEALICVSEEKKSGFRGIFSPSSSVRSDHSGGSHHGRGVLKLKGRIYVRHVKKVVDTSVSGELSLTISMEDESLDSFILCFKDRSSHETWRSTINRLLEEVKGGHSKASRLMGLSAPRSANAPSSAGGSSMGMGFDLTSPSTTGYSVTPSTSTFPHREPSAGDLVYEQPIGPIHTPVDLVIVLSLPSPSFSNQLPLKVKLMKTSLSFILALLGPKDRISLVTCEMGINGIVRKTPFLSPCRYESRKRLEAFVDTLGSGRDGKDDFEVQVGREERYDVVTAVNVALDVVLQRKAKNPISGMVLISDTSDAIKRAQMDLVTARLDAANVPVHALGYGRSHDPSPLWMISNHTHGTYTFVKEWYHLRDSLAGVVGGLMSIAMDNMKLHLSCQENDFHVTKVSGTTQAIVSKNGKDVDIELRELRYGEIREILVELDLEKVESSDEQRYSGEGSSEFANNSESRQDGRVGGSQQGSTIRKSSSFNVDRRLGLDTLSVGDANALRDVVYEDALIDEVPVVEVDCSFHDPGVGRSVARLAHPVLLTVAILPSTAPLSSTPADPMIVRRRMELLASDMITRALLIASRRNFTHASRILRETKRIIETIVDGLRSHISSSLNHNGHSNGGRSKREAQTMFAIDGLSGTIQDLDSLLDGLEEHKELFERDHRNYSAQQAGVLRAQRSWTTRTPTERNYCTKEIGQIINLSGEWQGRS